MTESLSFMNQVLHVVLMPMFQCYDNRPGVVLRALSSTRVRQIMRVREDCDSRHALLAFGHARQQKTGK